MGLVFPSRDETVLGYELTIAKGGPKLEDAEQQGTSASSRRKITTDEEGYPQLPPGIPNILSMGRNGNVYMTARMQTIQVQALMLKIRAPPKA